MNDEPTNIILERLNRMDKRLDKLDTIQGDVLMLRESVRRIDPKMTSVSSYMAGFHAVFREEAQLREKPVAILVL